MILLPIQYWTKFKKCKFEKLNSQEILDIVQEYLEEKGFKYIKRKENTITFHKADGWASFDFKSFLMSGIIKVKEEKESMTVTNGNWMVLLIGLPFLFLLLLSKTRFSTLDENDLNILWAFFLWIFIGNLIARIIAHYSFRLRIEQLIRKNYAQQ